MVCAVLRYAVLCCTMLCRLQRHGVQPVDARSQRRLPVTDGRHVHDDAHVCTTHKRGSRLVEDGYDTGGGGSGQRGCFARSARSVAPSPSSRCVHLRRPGRLENMHQLASARGSEV